MTTSWVKFADVIPSFGTRVLIMFRCGHIEDATIHSDNDSPSGWAYCLFDGEMINDIPTHWMEIPQ